VRYHERVIARAALRSRAVALVAGASVFAAAACAAFGAAEDERQTGPPDAAPEPGDGAAGPDGGPGQPGDGAAGPLPAGGRPVFVTAKATLGAAVAASADGLCDQEASKAGLSGTFVAWFSTTTRSALDRLPDGVAWYDASGRLIFSSKQAVATSSLTTPIERTAANASVVEALVWTGTSATGAATAHTCADWSAYAGQGTVGVTGAKDAAWTDRTTRSCSQAAHVVCFGL
jgi:hypothetical protein